jgi:hypothetical protein
VRRKLTEHALHAALSPGDDVIAVSVRPEAVQCAALRAEWDRWNPGVRLDTLNSPHSSLGRAMVDSVQLDGRQVAVLHPRGPATTMALPDPAEPARPPPGDRPARQHRHRHLHDPLPAPHPIANPRGTLHAPTRAASTPADPDRRLARFPRAPPDATTPGSDATLTKGPRHAEAAGHARHPPA